jgi:hypothetical protein
MGGWNADIYDQSGLYLESLRGVSFAELKARVADMKRGERINFVPPLNAPIAEIDELERMGARKTLP